MDAKTQNIYNAIMNNQNLIEGVKSAYNESVEKSGDASFTRFMNAVKAIASENLDIKVSRSNTSSASLGWKNDIKAEFTGRGRQWFYVSLDDINPVLDKFDADGYDTSSYRSDINTAGKAWVRFASVSGTEQAPQLRVEVRINGSKADHPQNRVVMPYSENLNRLEGGKTPFALGLEGAKPSRNSDQPVKEDVVEDTDDVIVEETQTEETIVLQEDAIEYNADDVASEIQEPDFDIDSAFSELDELINSDNNDL